MKEKQRLRCRPRKSKVDRLTGEDLQGKRIGQLQRGTSSHYLRGPATGCKHDRLRTDGMLTTIPVNHHNRAAGFAGLNAAHPAGGQNGDRCVTRELLERLHRPRRGDEPGARLHQRSGAGGQAKRRKLGGSGGARRNQAVLESELPYGGQRAVETLRSRHPYVNAAGHGQKRLPAAPLEHPPPELRIHRKTGVERILVAIAVAPGSTVRRTEIVTR